MESLRRIILGKPSDEPYGVISERKDSQTYIVQSGDQMLAARWTGDALVAGDTVLISRTKFGAQIIQRLGMAGDNTPEEMVIAQ